jgi:DNA-binding transcriptional regulator YhcF (GntR family)
MMLVAVDEGDPRPLYAQLVTQIKEQIMSGELSPGEELPSVRELSTSLGINLHTVHRAYQKLRDEGVIQLRLGRRAKVAALRETPAGREEIESRLTVRLNELITEAFHLGLTPADFKRLVDGLLKAGRKPRRDTR